VVFVTPSGFKPETF